MARRLLTCLGLALGLVPSWASAFEVVGTSAQFSWQPASGPVGGYLIYVSRNGSDFPTFPNQLSRGTTVRVDGGVGDRIAIAVAAYSTAGVVGPRSEPSDPVRFVSTPSPPQIELSREVVVVSAIQGEEPPLERLTVANAGGGSLDFSLLPLSPRVRATPASGTSTTARVPITLEFDTLGLDEGPYYTGLYVNAPGAASRLLWIVVNVEPPVPVFTVSKEFVSAFSLLGRSPGETRLTVSSSIPGSGYTVATDSDWIRLDPPDGTPSATPDNVYVNLDSARLPAGTYWSYVYVIPTDPRAPVRLVEVTLTVIDPAAWQSGTGGLRCGLGYELAPVLPALLWLRRRRRGSLLALPPATRDAPP